ncbi:hypothetical protein ACMAZD_24970 [Vibrio sp. nBUS_14]|uniref:hypothetical protein n=1 Tax=Vibrio TaxID=662 RepID=UPI000C82586F|nr:hypothetical protein [Vibrio lentus]PMI90092.1 hypothetical protein BCU35_21995 [Vibrio lentus]
MSGFIQETDELGGERSPFDIDNDYRKYLQETDWYVLRLQETGKAIPENVVSNRDVARSKVQSSFVLSVEINTNGES